MARKSSGTILQEELYPPSAERPHVESTRDDLDDSRLVDLDVEEESPFLRGQKRVSARRSSIPRKTASRLLWACVAAALLCVVAIAAATLYEYGERSWRFRVDSSDNIDGAGMEKVTKAQIMEVMGGDIGRNIFFIPLAKQKTQLEQIPWVESASVMRFVPNRLRVEIHERTPAAFARVGPRISLIDAGGTLMELPQKHKYSFPVILGMNPGEPLSTRAPRMKAYNQLVRDLDSSGARYSQDLSEIDLSDLEDVKERVNDQAGDVLVHLGSSNYLTRYKIYVTHVQAWRQQFQKLESVDLRYDNQIIVNPDMQGTVKQASLTPPRASAALAAGVKPAPLATRLAPHGRAVPQPAFEITESKLNPKAIPGGVRRPVARTQVKLKGAKARKAGRKAAGPKKVALHGKPATSAAAKNGAGPARSMAAQKPSAGTRAPPAGLTTPGPAATTRPKPSPAIAKQQGTQSSNN